MIAVRKYTRVIFRSVNNTFRSATAALVITATSLCACQSALVPDHTNRKDERKAQELLNDKRYTFEDLLAGKPETVANAKQIFALTTDARLKQRLASVLLSIGVKDPIYYDYLVSGAQEALQNDMPWPTVYGKNGETISRTLETLNPEFVKWCETHHRDVRASFRAAYYEIPLPWYYLAGSGDPRTYDLLLAGLHSKNPMIASSAGRGLAKLRDNKAVDELIAAYHRAPLETRNDFAVDLLYIPDPRAQAAAEKLLNNPAAVADFRKLIKAKGISALFGY